jgi:hypothetical protein
VVRIAHLEASLPVMDVLPNTVYAREAFLPMRKFQNLLRIVNTQAK